MSVKIYSSTTYPSYVHRRYEVVLKDVLGVAHSYIIGPFKDQPKDDGSVREAQLGVALAEQEIQDWINEMERGNDPAHIARGGRFTHSKPLWNVWEDILDGALTPFLQNEDMQALLVCFLTCSRLTKKELEAVAGKGNGVLAEAAIATNTKAKLDGYIPLLNKKGKPR